jgi:hypothetical protein
MPCENKTRAKLGQDANLVVYKFDFCNVVNFGGYKIVCTMSSGKAFLGPERRKLRIERGLTQARVAVAGGLSTHCVNLLKTVSLCARHACSQWAFQPVHIHLLRDNRRRSQTRLESWNSSSSVDTRLNC